MSQRTNLVKAVHEHWILTGVDLDDANTMADELADHLANAEADGKSFETVVGSNLRSFADEWAEPVAEKRSPSTKIGLTAMGAAMFATCSVGASAIIEWTNQVTVRPIETGFAAILGGIVATTLVGSTSSRLNPRGGIRNAASLALVTGFAVAALFIGWFWLASTFEDAWTIEVPSWIAVVSAVVALTVVISPLMMLFGRFDQTDGWTKKMLHALGRFF